MVASLQFLDVYLAIARDLDAKVYPHCSLPREPLALEKLSMSTSVDDLRKVMANKTDAELYDVLHGHPDDYTADAVEAAKQEFASRNPAAPTLNSLSTAVEGQRRVEEAPLEWPLKILAFFVCGTSSITSSAPRARRGSCPGAALRHCGCRAAGLRR